MGASAAPHPEDELAVSQRLRRARERDTVVTVMDVGEFWALVEQSGEGAPDLEQRSECLVSLLAARSAEEILRFQRLFAERVVDAYRWDWMAVAAIVNGGGTAERFDAFVGWVMAQGRAYFEAALADPPRAADRAQPGQRAEFAAIWSAPATAYARRTGRDDFHESAEPISIVMEGDRWQEEELDQLYPALVERFRSERAGP
jgi:hypothetical protein